jgi:RNA polymerase sigma-70 factor (ECF subfamily)
MTEMRPTPEGSIEDDLVVRAREDRAAFGELYDTIYPLIFRYCLRRVGDRSLADDITSTVFLSVADKIAAFEGSTFQEFRRWIFTIATNAINTDYRNTTRHRVLLADAAHSGRLLGPTGAEVVDAKFEGDALQEAIMQLSERAQAIITMRFFSELPYEDIGQILNLSPGAVRTAASRALEQIRNELRSE